ncbi:sugar nucleotide-binding protein [Paenibacillus sp. FSL H3-0457]|uniref:SDR family oxidoreductase n=1 Tax=Paenibacillus sp. FSL H3-0457 TaxID=2921430 RepID=UPI0030ECAF40
MKLLVCGSTGMLGQALVKEFNQLQIEVYTLARKHADINLDFLNVEDLKQALETLDPDVVVNAVAIVDLKKCEEDPSLAYLLNARPVGVLAEYANVNNKYLVQISTDHYYCDQGNVVHNEMSPISLLNEYAKTKFAGECFALTARNSLVVRTNIVGYRRVEERPTFIEWVLKSLINKDEMMLFDNVYTSSIAVSQLAQIVYDLITAKARGVFNVASRQSVSKKEFVQRLAEKFELSTENTNVKKFQNEGKPYRATSMGLEVRKVENFLGYRMPDTVEVIERLYKDYLEVNHF